MGVTKQYLRFSPTGIFGVVAAKNCNAVYLQPNRFLAAGGTHVITVWDRRLQRKVKTMNCDSPAVILKPNHDATMLAVGHAGGGVGIYDLKDKSEEASPDPEVTFEGHTSSVMSLAWDDSGTVLASGGKDTRVILWDCVSETGIAKLKGHKGPVTQLRFWNESKYLLSSSIDATVHVWDTRTNECIHTIACIGQVWDVNIWRDTIIIAENHLKVVRLTEALPEVSLSSEVRDDWLNESVGTLLRHSHDRCSSLLVVEDRYLVVSGSKSSEIEIFILSTPEEALKKQKKRLKKNPSDEKGLVLRDLIRRAESVKASEGKVKSIDAFIDKDKSLKILCCLPSNQVEVITFNETSQQLSDSAEPVSGGDIFGFDGHRKLVRAICFSSDRTAILTASADCIRVWNRSALTCVLTIPHEYPIVSASFCPGDRHFIAGSTSGHLILGDISTGVITQVEESGSDNVWSIDILSNNMGFATCNGSFVQFYDFFMTEGKLQFELKRQLDVQDSILSVKVSQDMKFVATGLLDSTIKLFYFDTLKFHLAMYGHSLPVLSVDISSDSQLLVSCSSDKTVRVWGLDFGDCHATMKHSDGLVSCAFQERTHYIFSIAKDSLNVYDGDNHQRVQTLKAHVEGGATCMGVGGLYVATAGRDQTIRLYNRTQDILVIDDEREQEREEELEKDAVVENPSLPALKTAESERSADKLIEALDAHKEDSPSNPLFTAYGAKDKTEFILKILTGIKASELEQSVMLLPVEYVNRFIPVIGEVLSDKDNLKRVASLAEQRQKYLVDMIGFNLAGLKFLSNRREEKQEIETFREMVGERKRKRKKKEAALKRALLKI
ncbi:unnamed protein product [Allacma fusca]|uniref:Small-subunit processome Utp12 domain-containing protein n=1 Tax=Allacma fusca TaxID=39272 RepID=A0A8J2NN83_9HEXA|nr:unnamed protein product [Allacma fusca]